MTKSLGFRAAILSIAIFALFCLAWQLAKSEVVIPIPGSSRPKTITDSATAVDLELSSDELAQLDAAG